MAAIFNFVLGALLRVLGVALITALVFVIWGVAPADLVLQVIDYDFVVNEKVRLAVLVFGLVVLCFVVYAALYPRLPTRSQDAIPEESTHYAMQYLLDHAQWGKDNHGERAIFRALTQLETEARKGRLTIWGRAKDSLKYQRIPPDYWENAGLDIERHVSDSRPMQTSARPVRGKLIFWPSIYLDVHVDEDQLKRLWPRRWSIVLRETARRFLPASIRDRLIPLPSLE